MKKLMGGAFHFTDQTKVLLLDLNILTTSSTTLYRYVDFLPFFSYLPTFFVILRTNPLIVMNPKRPFILTIESIKWMNTDVVIHLHW